jgi:hypothetical protein
MARSAEPVFSDTTLAGASVPGFRPGLRVPAATWTSVAWRRVGKRCCCQMLPAVRRTAPPEPQGLPVHRTPVVLRVRRCEPVARWEQAGRVRRAPLPLACRRTTTAQPGSLHRDGVPGAGLLVRVQSPEGAPSGGMGRRALDARPVHRFGQRLVGRMAWVRRSARVAPMTPQVQGWMALPGACTARSHVHGVAAAVSPASRRRVQVLRSLPPCLAQPGFRLRRLASLERVLVAVPVAPATSR